MKHMLISVLLLVSLTVAAQEINIDLDDFSEVKISKQLHVNFTPYSENKAVISGRNGDKVKITAYEGVLEVSSSIPHPLEEDSTIIDIFYKSLERIEASHNSNIEICTRLKQDNMMFEAREGASILGNIEVKNLTVFARTGGKVSLEGNAENQNIIINTSGEFKGENLIGSMIWANLNTGGIANIFSKNYVEAKVASGAHLYIYGTPEKVDEKTAFGGTIKKIN